MTAHIRSTRLLVGAAVAALIAPLIAVMVMASSATAAVGPRPHEVYMYKVEKHVDLSGEYPDNELHDHLFCNDGDIALDGMWRVSHVDQENPQLGVFGDERDVVVHASYSDGTNPSKWHYEIENYADGNAQLKLYLTCIRQNTEKNDKHKHAIKLDPTLRVGVVVATSGSDLAIPVSQAQACPAGYYAVAPGYNFPADFSGHNFRYRENRLVGSKPADFGKSWTWKFVVAPTTVGVFISYRCLATEVAPYGTAPKAHTHQLPMQWRQPPNGYPFHLDFGWNEYQASCDDGHDGAFYQDYKAMVGGFWIKDWHHNWYLGMEPRPKTRAYWFWNDGGHDDVWYGNLCIKSRTGKQIKPTLS